MIARCYFSNQFDQCELHIVSSRDVFCAAGFLLARIIKTQKTKLAFVFGKASIAPMKALPFSKLPRGPSFLVGYEYLSNHIWMLLLISFQKSVLNIIDNSPHALTSISKQSEPVFV